jgi:hypothetical protein
VLLSDFFSGSSEVETSIGYAQPYVVDCTNTEFSEKSYFYVHSLTFDSPLQQLFVFGLPTIINGTKCEIVVHESWASIGTWHPDNRHIIDRTMSRGATPLTCYIYLVIGRPVSFHVFQVLPFHSYT